MKPLIKWTGGKYSEAKNFLHLVPKFDRYIEPFFGGGGVFFSLEPQVESFINDKSIDLMSFYNLLKNKKFKNYLEEYASFWCLIGKVSKEKYKPIGEFYYLFKSNEISKDELREKIDNFINDKVSVYFDFNLNKSFFVYDGIIQIIKNCLVDKLNRIKNIELKEEKVFSEEEMGQHVETAFKSGFYTHFRNILNENQTKEKSKISEEKRIANWYLIRELCYGAMFRFNENGEFNIPYGAIGYNKKDLMHKIQKIFSKDCEKLFAKTKAYNLDFEKFINKVSPNENDFMFVDPPYDSTFKKYDNNAFGRESHERLASVLYSTKCKWMLVIKNTEFIYGLYDKKGINIVSFDKKYMYNARGRNDRNTEHLIIKNY